MAQFGKHVQLQIGKALAYLRDVFWPAMPKPATPPTDPTPVAARPIQVEVPPQASAEVAAPPVQEEPDEVQGDARVRAMLEATTLTEKRTLAKAHPELRPPYSFFDDDVNDQLEQVLWGSVSLTKAGVEQEDIQRALETMYARSKLKPLEPYRPG